MQGSLIYGDRQGVASILIVRAVLIIIIRTMIMIIFMIRGIIYLGSDTHHICI